MYVCCPVGVYEFDLIMLFVIMFGLFDFVCDLIGCGLLCVITYCCEIVCCFD